MNGGTSIIPNLDSIDEFRVLTNNFDPEYGNYNGGMVTVVTKPGTNNLHGDTFEFFRNTALDARGYFDPTRSAFKQNQYGGTLGGTIRRDKIFFFADYQGTRTNQGVSTGNISVPTVAERSGDFNDLTGSVSGPYLAVAAHAEARAMRSQSGEPLHQRLSQRHHSAERLVRPRQRPAEYIPSAQHQRKPIFHLSFAQTVRDDKGSVRIDANSRFGQISGLLLHR